LIISFDSGELRDCCCDLASAERKLGSALAETLVSLIADAEAFDNADALMAFFDEDASLDADDVLSLAIGPDRRVRFVPVGVAFVRDGAGKVDWTSVRRLKLIQISEGL
jgi:hypothetical protein